MISIEKICENITNTIADGLDLEKNERAIINYGIFGIIHTFISVLAVIVLGGLFGVLIPAMIVSLTAALLRKYSGGVHARTPESCAIIGALISVLGGLGAQCIAWDVKSVIIVGMISFSIGFYLVYKLAPVDSPAKPIKKAEKINSLKKKSIFIVQTYLLVAIVMYLVNRNQEVLVYIICLYIGMLWQVFTLTSKGHWIVQKIDYFLIKNILNKKEYLK